jgi:L-fuconolactonase
MRVDSHHHLWRYSPEEYPWISPASEVLRRDYLGEDLAREMRAARIDRAVAVQARDALVENDFLLAQADAWPQVAGVVGWVDLAADDVDAVLERYAAHPRFRGVRHGVQGEPAGFMLGEAFNRGVGRLARNGLVYDLLVVGRQLTEAAAFVDRHPAQAFVLDHIGKPTIIDGHFDDAWAGAFRELAQRPHVSCKLSGIVTQVQDSHWTAELVRPYVELALESFGPARLMFGTDWPVCLRRVEYAAWVETAERLLVALTDTEQSAVFGDTAWRVYGLGG